MLTMQTSASVIERNLRLTLLGRLQDAEDDHDRTRREALSGVTLENLEADKVRWSQLGGALAALARQICQTCAASAFGEARPKVDSVTLRLSEAIDDQLDAP